MSPPAALRNRWFSSPERPTITVLHQLLEDLLAPLQLQPLPAHPRLVALPYLGRQQQHHLYSECVSMELPLLQTSGRARSHQFIDVRGVVGSTPVLVTLTAGRGRLLALALGRLLQRRGLLGFLPRPHCERKKQQRSDPGGLVAWLLATPGFSRRAYEGELLLLNDFGSSYQTWISRGRFTYSCPVATAGIAMSHTSSEAGVTRGFKSARG